MYKKIIFFIYIIFIFINNNAFSKEIISIYDFDAVGNGRIDTISSFDRAIDYLKNRGGGVLDLESGIHLISNVIKIEDANNITISTTGNATIIKKNTVSNNQSGFFHIERSSNITINNFNIEGNYSANLFSTGSNPCIMIGSYRPKNNGDINSNIIIRDLSIKGCNWSAIMVYARQNLKKIQKNNYISIHNNIIYNSSNGIFVYKNAKSVNIHDNYIYNIGRDGIAIDTRAATDSDISMSISNVDISRNFIRNFGISGQGIGVLLKGIVINSLIDSNVILDAAINQKVIPPFNSGILIGPDFEKKSPINVVISNNIIKNIFSEGANSFGILVNSGSENINTYSNDISFVKSFGIYYEKATGSIINNIIKNIDGLWSVRLEGDKEDYIDWIRYEFNDVYGGGDSKVGLFASYINNLFFKNNNYYELKNSEIISENIINTIKIY